MRYTGQPGYKGWTRFQPILDWTCGPIRLLLADYKVRQKLTPLVDNQKICM
jgi:3'-phosphoadenosine 5'-phosphosulfate sulfotransferase (PAPS reductase)/FAD synthetase